jgi:hypothetical protein
MEKHNIEHPKAKFDRLRMLNSLKESTNSSSQSSIFSEGTTIDSSNYRSSDQIDQGNIHRKLLSFK